MGTNNAINNSFFGPNGGLNLTGFKLISAFQKGISIGTTDLYTAPAGKRAIVFPCYGANCNTTAVNVTMSPKLKSGGVYYAMSTTAAVIGQGAAISAANKNGTFILEPGESASVTVATSAVNTFGYSIIEFDSTIPLKTARVNALGATNNTIYTCPSSTLAFILDLNGQMDCGTSVGQLYLTNNSGSTASVNWYVLNSGGTIGNSYNVSGQAVVTTAASNLAGLTAANLGAGDSIVISSNVATAGQVAWVNVLECPA